jgi:hypothetical protein
MSGMFRSVTGSSVNRQAARRGRAAFLFPLGTSVPEIGCPPSIKSFSTALPSYDPPRSHSAIKDPGVDSQGL